MPKMAGTLFVACDVIRTGRGMASEVASIGR
jgi:hypothetical protein